MFNLFKKNGSRASASMDVSPVNLSRAALEQHIRCPRCFYLQRRKGLKPPSMAPLTLAIATDALLKNEFDVVRSTGAMHPLWQRESLPMRAYDHADIDAWRNNFKGIRIQHSTGITVSGAVDDVWQNTKTGELHIVDYKSTSKSETPSLEGVFGSGYKRQIEIYQWLFRRAGFKVSDTGYFLYVNGRKDGGFYDMRGEGVMKFTTSLIPHTGDDRWVDDAITKAVDCLQSPALPKGAEDCDTCRYFSERLRSESA